MAVLAIAIVIVVVFFGFFITMSVKQSRLRKAGNDILQQEALAAGMQPYRIVLWMKAPLPDDREREKMARQEAHAAGMHLETPAMPHLRYIGPNGPATITTGGRTVPPVIYGDYCGTFTLPLILYDLNLNSPANRQQLATAPLEVQMEGDSFTLQLSEAPPIVMPHPISIRTENRDASYMFRPKAAAVGGKASSLDLAYWEMVRQDGAVLVSGDYALPQMSRVEFAMFLTVLLTDLSVFLSPPVPARGSIA